MCVLNKCICLFILVAGSCVVNAQEPSYYYELEDTTNIGIRKVIKFMDIEKNKKGDSIYALGINRIDYIDGWKYGFLIAKCDTQTLTCDTAEHWWYRGKLPFFTYYYPDNISLYENNRIIASVKTVYWGMGEYEKYGETEFHVINPSTLRADSTFKIKHYEDSLFFGIANNDIQYLNKRSFIISGWSYRDTTGDDRPGILIKYNEDLEVEWHRWFYINGKNANIRYIDRLNDRIIVYGNRFEYHPEHYAQNQSLRTLFIGAYDIQTGDELWRKTFDRKFISANRASMLICDEANDRFYFAVRSRLKPIHSTPYRPDLGLYGKTQLNAYDKDGNELWSKMYDTASKIDYHTQTISFDSDSNIVSVGILEDKGLNSDYYLERQGYTQKWDRNTGEEIHFKAFEKNWSWDQKSFMAGIIPLETGSFITGGYVNYYQSRKAFLRKFNQHGCQQPGDCYGEPPLAVEVVPEQPDETKVFPNPATDQIRISRPAQSQPKNYRLISINVKEIKNGRLNSPEENIEVSDLTSGVYLLIVESEKEQFTEKIMIK